MAITVSVTSVVQLGHFAFAVCLVFLPEIIDLGWWLLTLRLVVVVVVVIIWFMVKKNCRLVELGVH